MIKKALRLLSIGCLLLAAIGSKSLSAQALQKQYLLDYQIFDRSSGMRGNTPLSAVEDSLGFVWMSTFDGLNRLDGEKFLFYPKSEFGILRKLSVYLFVDLQGLIWIQTGGLIHHESQGIDVFKETEVKIFNPYTFVYESFDDFFPQAPFCEEDICSLTGEGRAFFIMLSDGRIYQYDGTFRLLYADRQGLLTNISLAGASGRYYLAQGNRLLTLAPDKSIQSIDSIHFSIHRMYLWGDSAVVFGSPLINTPGVPYTYLKSGSAPARPLAVEGVRPKAPIKPMGTDTEGRAWVRVQDSVFVLTWAAHKPVLVHRFSLGPQAPTGSYASFNTGHHFWLVRPGVFTHVHLFANPFRWFLKDELSSVRGINQLPDGRLISTTYAGTKVVDLNNGQTTGIVPEVAYTGYRIHRDGNDYWLGTHGHIVRKYHYPTGTSVAISLKEEEKQHWAALLIPYVDGEGKLWVGMGGGMALMRPGEQALSILSIQAGWTQLGGALIRQFLPAPEGVWLATSEGIFLIDTRSEKIIASYTTPLGTDITHLNRDEKGNMWVVVNKNDLLYWDRASHSFEVFDLYSPLIDNSIHAALPDKYGRLWLPTNNGLYCLSIQSKRVKAYYAKAGLPENEFNSEAWFVLPDGSLALGGINGLILFNPDEMPLNEFKTDHVRLSQLITYHPQTGAREYHVGHFVQNGCLKLSSDRRKIELDFCLPDPGITHRAYFYRINATSPDEAWIPLQTGHLLINELGYGKNTIELTIKADMDLRYSGIIRIPIDIAFPWYTRWWAILLYATIVALAIRLYIKARLRQEILAKQLLEQEVLARTQELYQDKLLIETQNTALNQLNYFKDRMLGLVGHELKGPLLSLFGIAEKLAFLIKRERWQDVNKISTTIDQKVLDLRHILDNLLRWAQSMPGGAVSARKLELAQILLAEWKLMEEVAVQKNIEPRFSGLNQLQPRSVWFDPQALSVILRNLLHNAVKFSPRGGYIEASTQMSDNDKFVVLSLYNQGTGFPTEVLENIAQPHFFYSSKGTQGEAGTGLGLRLCLELMRQNNGSIQIQNKPQGGACVSLYLPLPTAEQVFLDLFSGS